VVAWKAGLRMIAAHPLDGVGIGNFKVLMPRYVDSDVKNDTIAHNSYLEVAAEMGIPQLLIFLGIMFFSGRSFEQIRRRVKHSGPKFVYKAALGLEAGLAGYAVGALTISAEYQKLFWLVLCLSMCLPALARDISPADERVAVPASKLPSWRPPARPIGSSRAPSQPSVPSEESGGSNAKQPRARRVLSGSGTHTLSRFSEKLRG
jgi:hypothetical protein